MHREARKKAYHTIPATAHNSSITFVLLGPVSTCTVTFSLSNGRSEMRKAAGLNRLGPRIG